MSRLAFLPKTRWRKAAKAVLFLEGLNLKPHPRREGRPRRGRWNLYPLLRRTSRHYNRIDAYEPPWPLRERRGGPSKENES